jgi:negative regulator of flagellin synthesis FlgM
VKINDINRVNGVDKYRKLNQKDQIKQHTSKKDQISISNEAKALLEQTKGTMNKEKVAQLKEQIDKGTYQLDSKQVADKMIEWFKKI